MAKLLEEFHPGEILLEDFMKPMGSAPDSSRRTSTFHRAGSP